jgi:hypothetical protein
MSEHKLRESSENLTILIEASDQERAAIAGFLNNFVRPKGHVDQKRHRRLFKNFKLRQIEIETDRLEAVEAGRAAANNTKPKPIGVTDFSDELKEYPTTADVVEYFLKTTDNAEIPGSWVNYVGEVQDRMEDKSYRAPSLRAAENGAPALPARENEAASEADA